MLIHDERRLVPGRLCVLLGLPTYDRFLDDGLFWLCAVATLSPLDLE